MFTARLVAYKPAGARLDSALLDGVSWDASFPLNDVSALSLAYPSVFDDAGLVDSPVELAVEVSAGGQWVEPPNARYLTSELQSDLTQPLDVPKFSFRGLGALLERPFILREQENAGKPYTSDEDDPKRNFLSATAGQIVLAVVGESRAKYPSMLQGITLNFTASHDSNGKPWNQLISNAYSAGTDLLRILDDLVGQGNIDWWMQGRALHVVNADSTSTTHDYRLFLGDASESPVRVTWEAMATHVQLEGGQGFYREQALPGVQVPYGTRVVRIANDSVTTVGTADTMIAAQANMAKAPRREYTRQVADLTTGPFPLVDWSVGDWVEAENYQRRYESMRVHALGVAWDAKEIMPSVRVTLNDRFVDASVREAKRLKGITHGATQVLGDGGVPKRVDKAVPAAPTGVVANSLGYWADAVPLASVDVSWKAVTTSVDGLPLNGVDYYDVKVGGLSKRAEGTSVGFDGLQPSRIYEVRVRAVSRTGIVGRWSAFREVLTAYPLPDLDPPTAPVLTTGLGSIQVEWDGKLQGTGAAYKPPLHFSHILVETLKVGTTTWVEWPRDHGFVQTGLIAGDEYDVRLVAVDMLGRPSDPSPVTRVTVESLVQDALDHANEAAAEALQAKGDALRAYQEASEGEVGTGRIVVTDGGYSIAVVNALVSDQAFLDSLYTNRVIVAPQDYAPGPGGYESAYVFGAAADLGNSNYDPTGKYIRIDVSNSYTNQRMAWGPLLPARPGDKISFEAYATSGTTDPGTTWSTALYWYGPDGETAATGGEASFITTTAQSGGTTGWSRGVVTAPKGTAYARVRFYSGYNADGGIRGFRNLNVKKQVGPVLIEDGAITAPKIFAGAVTAEKIKAGALDAFQITSPLIQSVSTANRGIKWNGANLVGYNNSGDETFRLDATRATITGGTIQTVETANRGVKITSTGLRAYDSSGNETVTITSGGVATVTGTLIASHPNAGAVRIAGAAYGSNRPGIWLDPDDGPLPARIYTTGAGGEGLWGSRATVMSGTADTETSGRADLALYHGGDIDLRQNWGANTGVGFRKIDNGVSLSGVLRHEADGKTTFTTFSGAYTIPAGGTNTTTVTYSTPATTGLARVVFLTTNGMGYTVGAASQTRSSYTQLLAGPPNGTVAVRTLAVLVAA